MPLFSRRTFAWRYSVIAGLIVNFVLFAGFLQYIPVSINMDADSLDLNGIDGGPTPSSVAAALRAPLEFRPDAAEVANERVRELASTTPTRLLSTTSPTKKPPEDDRAMNLLDRNSSILHKVNMSDVMKVANVAAAVDVPSNSQAVNPHPFKYILNNPNVCKDQHIYIIAYVHTAPDHYKRRVVIRQTWGAPSNYDSEYNLRVIFVMGRTAGGPNDDVQKALEFESEQYGDIVQEDFLDSYKNLTYKGVAALKWIDERCSHARWVLKTDDDIFVNSFNLLRQLKRIERREADEIAEAEARHVTVSPNSTKSSRGVLMCLVWYSMMVMREGKWKVDKSEWAADSYPTYCSGSAFVMSTDVAVALHRVSYDVPFFWVDDLYVTGLLVLKAGPQRVRHVQFMSTYLLDGRKLAEKFTGSQWYQYIFSHVHDLNAIQAVWKKVVRISNGSLSPTVQYALPGDLQRIALEAAQRDKEQAAKKS